VLIGSYTWGQYLPSIGTYTHLSIPNLLVLSYYCVQQMNYAARKGSRCQYRR
jgi:hypothetical protein